MVLISGLLYNFESRFKVKEVINHLIIWSSEKKLAFLNEVSNTFDVEVHGSHSVATLQ